jgi:hypothetical protein
MDCYLLTYLFADSSVSEHYQFYRGESVFILADEGFTKQTDTLVQYGGCGGRFIFCTVGERIHNAQNSLSQMIWRGVLNRMHHRA